MKTWFLYCFIKKWFHTILYHFKGCCNRIVRYTSETHPKPKTFENLLIHNIHFRCSVILKFCTEHGNITAMLWTKFQNNWATDVFMRFEFKMCFAFLYCNSPPGSRQQMAHTSLGTIFTRQLILKHLQPVISGILAARCTIPEHWNPPFGSSDDHSLGFFLWQDNLNHKDFPLKCCNQSTNIVTNEWQQFGPMNDSNLEMPWHNEHTEQNSSHWKILSHIQLHSLLITDKRCYMPSQILVLSNHWFRWWL